MKRFIPILCTILYCTIHFCFGQESSWSTITNLLTGRATYSANIVNGKIYAIGDSKGDSTEWESLKDMPTARWMYLASVFEEKIYVFWGAKSYSGGAINSFEIYDPELDT